MLPFPPSTYIGHQSFLSFFTQSRTVFSETVLPSISGMRSWAFGTFTSTPSSTHCRMPSRSASTFSRCFFASRFAFLARPWAR